MEFEAKKCTLGKRKGSNQHRFVDCCLLSFPRFVHQAGGQFSTFHLFATANVGCTI